MPLFRHKNKVIFFVHIPKTGGSSVEHCLRQSGAIRALHYHKRLDYLECTMQHMHAELHEILVPEQFHDGSFAVVRHPIDRLLSEYKWRLKLGQINRKFDDWVNHTFNRYADNPYIMDNHIRPQSEFIGKGTKTYRFEDGLDIVVLELAELLHIKPQKIEHRRKGDDVTIQWSKTTAERAKRFYAEDFRNFEYDESYINQNIYFL
jgi:hypothetical protein